MIFSLTSLSWRTTLHGSTAILLKLSLEYHINNTMVQAFPYIKAQISSDTITLPW